MATVVDLLLNDYPDLDRQELKELAWGSFGIDDYKLLTDYLQHMGDDAALKPHHPLLKSLLVLLLQTNQHKVNHNRYLIAERFGLACIGRLIKNIDMLSKMASDHGWVSRKLLELNKNMFDMFEIEDYGSYVEYIQSLNIPLTNRVEPVSPERFDAMLFDGDNLSADAKNVALNYIVDGGATLERTVRIQKIVHKVNSGILSDPNRLLDILLNIEFDKDANIIAMILMIRGSIDNTIFEAFKVSDLSPNENMIHPTLYQLKLFVRDGFDIFRHPVMFTGRSPAFLYKDQQTQLLDRFTAGSELILAINIFSQKGLDLLTSPEYQETKVGRFLGTVNPESYSDSLQAAKILIVMLTSKNTLYDHWLKLWLPLIERQGNPLTQNLYPLYQKYRSDLLQ